MFDKFDYFNRGYIFGVKTDKYKPYINYSWSQTLTASNNQQIKDTGTAGLNLQQFFGQGCWFNGIDMQVTIPVNATIKTEIKRVNGVVEINTNTQALNNYNVYSGTGAKVYKDLYMFDRVLTQIEIDKYNNQPNQFFMDSLEDSSCVLAMPMCEKSNIVRNYKNNTDYPITNYLATCRTNAQRLSYGLQTSGFKRDSNGLILSKSSFLEADGVGYANTGWLPSPLPDEEGIEIIFKLSTQVGFRKLFTVNNSNAFMVQNLNSTHTHRCYYRGALGSTTQPENSIVYVVMTCNATTSFMYINGVLINQVPKVSIITNMALLFTSTTLIDNSSSLIRLFKVHTKVLTQEEVTQNFNKYQSQGLLNA